MAPAAAAVRIPGTLAPAAAASAAALPDAAPQSASSCTPEHQHRAEKQQVSKTLTVQIKTILMH